MSDHASRSTNTRPLWIIVGVLLVIGILLPLLVGIYDKETPTLGGFPFYYWFQFLLIPITAVLTFTAFKISESATRRDRETRGQAGRSGSGDPR
jgi:CBS domain containing-hemolysin-like protein